MLIKLTNAHTKHIFGLMDNTIWAVERSIENALLTKVITTMHNQGGPIGFEVMESPEDICDAIARLNGKEPQMESGAGKGKQLV